MTVPGDPQPHQSPSSQAITAMVVSLLGIVMCCILAPIGWYLGNQEQKAIREGRSPAAGETLAKVATILGMVGTLIMAFTLFWIFFLGGMAVLSGIMGS